MSTLHVKVVPGSSRNTIVGWLGDILKIRVTAKAERGEANAALVALLAERLGVRKQDVRITAGASSPRKVIRINGLSDSQLRYRLHRPGTG